MFRSISLFIFLATSAQAGDSTTPGPVENLVPFVIETADLGPYIPGMALSIVGGNWTDEQLTDFVFGGDPLPAEVPLGNTLVFLGSAVGAMVFLKSIKKG